MRAFVWAVGARLSSQVGGSCALCVVGVRSPCFQDRTAPPAKKCFTMPSWRSPLTMQSCLLLACVLAFTASAQTTTPAAASSFCGVVNSLLPQSPSDTLGVNCKCSEVSFGFKLACTATAQITPITEKTTDVVLSYNFQPCASTAEMGYLAIATITPYTLVGTSPSISATLAKEELKAVRKLVLTIRCK